MVYSYLFSLLISNIVAEINQIITPSKACGDQLVWSLIDFGILSFKDAYKTLHPTCLELSWSKKTSSAAIPASKPFIIWSLFHNKMTTDDHFWNRGCVVVSHCRLCFHAYETFDHLFFDYVFSTQL